MNTPIKLFIMIPKKWIIGLIFLWGTQLQGSTAQIFDRDGFQDEYGFENNGRRHSRFDNDEENLQNLDYYSPPNYEFEYQVHGGGNNLGHREERTEAQINGKYFVDLPNGMRQTVVYTADENGFRPIITYEAISNSESSPTPGPPVDEPVTFKGNYNLSSRRRNNASPPSRSTQSPTISPVEEVQSYGLTPPNLKRRRRKQRKVVIVRSQKYNNEFPEFGLRIRRRSSHPREQP